MCMLRSALEPEGTGHRRVNQSSRKALPVTCMHRGAQPHFDTTGTESESTAQLPSEHACEAALYSTTKRQSTRQSTVSTSMPHKVMSQRAVGEPRGKRSTQGEEAVELGAAEDEQSPPELYQNWACNPGHEDER